MLRSLMLIGLLALSWVSGCGGDSDRQEVVDRLRGLGLVATPLAQIPSDGASVQTVDVEVYVAVLDDEEITVTPYLDDPVANAYMAPTDSVAIDETTIAYADYNGFRLATFTATVTIPDIQILQAGRDEFIGIQIRYGFEVATASDVEVVTGSFLVYPEGSAELDWELPNVSIVEPEDGLSVSPGQEVDLKGSVTDLNDEDIKLGWFSTTGDIQNRRALETKWTAPNEAGDYTLVFTARGKTSRSFVLQTIDITVN